MSATSGHQFLAARSYTVARQRRIRRVLESCGPLTRDGLHELVHPQSWRVPFAVVLERAVGSDRVRSLGHDLYEAGPTR